MDLIKIKAKNFLSFKDLEYDFTKIPTLIVGSNLSDDSQESNGSGKSALQAAIEYCLFKTTSRKVLDIDLINWEEDFCELSLSIDCAIRKETLLITRKITKKGSTVEIFINDEKQSVATVNDANNFIIDWIGISKEDLQNYFILNKERYKSFFSSSNKEKIEMINRFSNAQLIYGVNKFVEDDLEKIKLEINQLDFKKNSILTTIKIYHKQIKDEFNRDFDKEREENKNLLIEEIRNKESKLIEIDDDIIHRKESIKIKEHKLIEIEDEVMSLSMVKKEVENKFLELNQKFQKLINENSGIVSDLDLIESSNSELYKKREKYLRDKNELEEIIAEINNLLAGVIECPKCKHKFVLNSNVNVNEEKNQKEESEQLLGVLNISITSINNEIGKSSDSIKSLNNKKTNNRLKELSLSSEKKKIELELSNLESKIQNLNKSKIYIEDVEIPHQLAEINNLLSSVKSIKTEISNTNDKIKNLKLGHIDLNRINEWKLLMRDLGSELRLKTKELKELKLKENEISLWIFNFKKFNMYLANQSLKIIQGYCNKFLQDIKSDIQIRWEGVKLLASGELREEITPYIIRNNQMKGFWSFSGGERARMDYSMIFTLQDMINKTNKYGGLNFLSTDEIAEGIDSLGLSDLMDSMNDLNRTILITTHVVNRKVGSNVLMVTKKDGVSTIQTN